MLLKFLLIFGAKISYNKLKQDLYLMNLFDQGHWVIATTSTMEI